MTKKPKKLKPKPSGITKQRVDRALTAAMNLEEEIATLLQSVNDDEAVVSKHTSKHLAAAERHAKRTATTLAKAHNSF